MSDSGAPPLRGEAAWRASVKEIARRNQAAQAEGARRRATKDAAADREAALLARREVRDFPRQPGRR
jgi:hypothetical protein